MNILYIEDDMMVARAVCRVLQDAGHVFVHYVAARDAADVLGACPENFDLVLSDWAVADGFSAPALRAAMKAGIPAAFLTATPQVLLPEDLRALPYNDKSDFTVESVKALIARATAQ